MPNCKQCTSPFEITDADRKFYEKVQTPEPTLCPPCREQRRMAFRNEMALFKRQCDLCNKDMISVHDTNTSYPVFCNDCWWSDKWDPTDYDQDYDFSRPFFNQFQELTSKVPKAGFMQLSNENCDYNSLLAYSKNTYMSPGGYFLEDCYYCRKSQYSKDCLNGTSLDHCELVAESVNSGHCYNSHHLINCRNVSDCAYVSDSIGCKHCFMCSGLSQKEYHFKNQPLSKEEYEKKVEEELKRPSEELLQEFLEFNKTIPKKFQNQINCQDCSGDYLQNSKNAIECYDCFDIEDCKYMCDCVNVKDSMDLTNHDKDVELCYELSIGGETNVNVKFSVCPCAAHDADYLIYCFYLTDSFGCEGFHRKQSHCILNKKYKPDEYQELKGRIIEHMKSTGEYGEFFPIRLSPFCYNDTIAQTYYPITEEGANKNGWRWRKEDPKEYQPATAELPADINEVPDSIVNEILACSDCGKNYRIIAQELKLSRKIGISLSTRCADCRLKHLFSLKNPRKLYNRQCDKCQADIQTTYSPDRPEKVYCEKCYLKEVY
jgi:hypothetical protein